MCNSTFSKNIKEVISLCISISIYSSFSERFLFLLERLEQIKSFTFATGELIPFENTPRSSFND